MTLADGLFVLALVLLLTIAASLWRIHAGPRQLDRMMGAQLIGTGGVALVLLLAAATGDPTKLDVAIVLALLAAFAALAFAKTASRDASGDPENARPEVESFSADEEDRR
jgi:multicomponent Na+:H+ antiporter subunit F